MQAGVGVDYGFGHTVEAGKGRDDSSESRAGLCLGATRGPARARSRAAEDGAEEKRVDGRAMRAK